MSKQLRALPWVATRFAKARKPSVIFVENVPEFITWGPIGADDQPVASKKGATFRAFVRRFEALGYIVEWRVLNAADYGAPTHRKRLFLVARRDGKPIVWPAPTHGPGRPLPYRTAAECIDWNVPCKSLFGRTRPLAHATQRRIAEGFRRFVLQHPDPFLVQVNHGRDVHRAQPFDQPLPTVSTKHGFGIAAPSLIRTAHGDVDKSGKKRGKGFHDAQEPLGTVTAGGGDFALGTPILVQYNGESLAHSLRGTVPTMTTMNHLAVAAPYLVANNTNNAPKHAATPLGSITTGGRHVFLSPLITPVKTWGGGGNNAKSASDGPLRTITTSKGGEFAMATPVLVQTSYGEREGQRPRYLDLFSPLGCVVAGGGKHAVAMAWLAKHNGKTIGQSLDGPMHTIVAGLNKGVVAAHLTKFYGTNIGSDLPDPAPTITGQGQKLGVVAAHLSKFNGEKEGRVRAGQPADDPLHTITPEPRFAAITTHLLPASLGADSSSCERLLRLVLERARRVASAAEAASGKRRKPTKKRLDDEAQPISSRSSKKKPSARPTGPAPRRPRRGRRNPSTVMPQIDWLMLTDPSDGESFWNLGAAGGFTVPRPIRFLPHIRELAAMLERGEITEEQAVGACEVSAFLRKHLGIEFASPFVTIQGQAYIIVDIQLRMLTPRELARAQGFSDDYILTGTQEQQVARIGNSVSPPVAQALVQANAPSPTEMSS